MSLKQVINKSEAEAAFERDFIDFIEDESKNDTSQEATQIINFRKKAFEIMLKNGLPNRKYEDFKYSDWRIALKGEYKCSNLRFDELDIYKDGIKIADEFKDLEPYIINVINGKYSFGDDNLKNVQVSLSPYADMVDDYENSMIALNNSFNKQVLNITTHKNKIADKVILLNYINGLQGEKIAIFSSSEITVEENSSLIIIENLQGISANNNDKTHKQADDYLFNQLNNITLKEGASLIHIRLQVDDDQLNFSHQQIELKKDASYKRYSVNGAGEFVREQSEININGENCDVKLNGAYLLSKAQHCDHNIKMNHNKGHSFSDQQYRGVMVDRAKGAFVGNIFVAKGADGTDGKQMSKALLLGDKASHNGKPELEIYADDVKCAHGATVGAIDEKALFFLRARGIDEKTAKSMLIRAFIDEIFDGLEEDDRSDEKLLFKAVKNCLNKALGKIIES